MNSASALGGAIGLSYIMVACASPSSASRGGTAPSSRPPSTQVPAIPSVSAAAAPERPPPKRECLAVSQQDPRPLFAWDPTSSYLAGFFDGNLRIWNLTGGTELTLAPLPAVRQLAWQSQGGLVATTPHSWVLFDPATGATITEREVGRAECDAAPILDPDATLVAYAVDLQGTIEIENSRTNEGTQLRTRLAGAVPVRWVDRGSGLAVRGADGVIELWAYPSGARAWRCEPCRGLLDDEVAELGVDAISPDGRSVPVYRQRDADYDQPGAEDRVWLEIIEGESGAVQRIDEWVPRYDPSQSLGPLAMGVVWGSDNRRAIAVERLHVSHSPADVTEFRLYDAQSWKVIRNLGGEGGTGTRVTSGFTHDDKLIWIQYLANSPLHMELRDAATDSKLHAFTTCGEIFPSPDGKLGAEFCDVPQLRSLTTGGVIRTLASSPPGPVR